jgi:hypothetical protein
MKTTRTLFLLVVMSVLPYLAAAQTGPTKWHDSKVNNQFINDRWAQLAEQYKSSLPVSKVAIFDIGYTRSADEFEKLDGFGVVLVSALSETRDQLPIAKVFVTLNGSDINLVEMHSFLTTGAGISDVVTHGSGGYRMDAIYAFPVWLRFQPVELKVEFAKDKEPMTLAKFTSAMSDTVKALPNRKPKGTVLSLRTARAVHAARVPGLFREWSEWRITF